MGPDFSANQAQDNVWAGVDQANSFLKSIAIQRAGGMLAAGKGPDAVNALNQSGQLDAANTVQTRLTAQDTAAQAHSAQMVKDVTTALDQIRVKDGDEAVLPAFDHLTPIFLQKGAKPEEIAGIRKAIEANPEQALQAFSAHADMALKQFSLTPGMTRYNEDGKVIADNPRADIIKTMGPDQTLARIAPTANGQPINNGQQPPQGPTNGAFPPAQAMPQGEAPAGADPLAGGIDPNAVQQVESGGNPNAVSPAGASGPMQTMPGTLLDPGFGVTPARPGPDGKVTPQEKARVGKDYLSALQSHYGNNALALLAYNWGPGKVDSWVKSGMDFNKLPPESQQYLGRVAVAGAKGQKYQPTLDDSHLGAADTQPSDNGVQVLMHTAPKASTSTAMTLSPEAIKMAAFTYRATKQMPASLGRGGAAQQAILNEAARQNEEEHQTTADMISHQADYTSSAKALGTMTTQRAQIGAFEGTVNDGIGLIRKLAVKGSAQSGIPVVNAWIQAGRKSVQGDPDVTAFNNAIQTTTNEYAKVVSGASNGAVTSDTARAHAAELINNAMTPEALEAALQVLQKEMAFRTSNMDKTIETLKSHMTGTHSATAPAPKVRKWNPATGKIEG